MSTSVETIIDEPSVEKKVIDEYFRLSKSYIEKYGPKTITLYQVGNFYEVYGYRDPQIPNTLQGSLIDLYSDVCSLRVAERNLLYKKKYSVSIAGFTTHPYQLEKYKEILLDNDFTVVIYIEEKDTPLSDSKKTRVLEGVYSPGTYIPENPDQSRVNPHLLCIWLKPYKIKQSNHISVGITVYNAVTNHSHILEFDVKDDKMHITTLDEVQHVLSIYQPKEVILISPYENTEAYIPLLSTTYVHHYSPELTMIKNAEKQRHCDYILNKHFAADALSQCMEFSEFPLATQSFVVLIHFLEEHNPSLCKKLALPHWGNHKKYVKCANRSLLQLNIIDDNNTQFSRIKRFNQKSYSSVCSLLNRCRTNMGSRLFYHKITHPIYDSTALEAEYAIMEKWIEDPLQYVVVQNLHPSFSKIHDIDHLARLLHIQKMQPPELAKLFSSISIAEQVWSCLAETQWMHNYVPLDRPFHEIHQSMQEWLHYLEKRINMTVCSRYNSNIIQTESLLNMTEFPAIADLYNRKKTCENQWNIIWMKIETLMNPTNPVKEGFVKREYNEKRGTYHFIMTKARSSRLKEKIDEMSKRKTQDDWWKTITMVPNSKKGYITISSPYLESLSEELITVQQLIQSTTLELYHSIVNTVMEKYDGFLSMISTIVSYLDVLWTNCVNAVEHNYCRPRIVAHNDSSPSMVDAKGLRHAIIEKFLRNECYVPNDIVLGDDKNVNGMLLFGTNAVGKTSLMRALGISMILAQSGMYVPCDSFTYIPYSAIYTRILSQDNLFQGQSTFSVEMSELRVIQNESNESSLVLGDELCSGTESTSALCIMLATLKILCNRKSSFLLATHFHEIVRYSELNELNRIRLCHLSVQYNPETDALEYERKLQDGPGNKNYGLEVCESLHMNRECMEDAYAIRSKYFPEFNGSLKCKTSRYNQEKVKGECENCHKVLASDIHHLQEQHKSNTRGFIGTIHKNHVGNLMSLCEECHNKMHHHDHDQDHEQEMDEAQTEMSPLTDNSRESGQSRRVKTTKGYRVKV